MNQIRDSLRKRPINLILIVIVLCAYFANRFCIKPAVAGFDKTSAVRYFFICYFNDLICPLFFFSYANILLISVHREMTRLPLILLISFCTSLVWEFVAPLFKPSATNDPFDMVCYIAGGFVYWLILRLSIKRQEDSPVT